LTPTQAAIQLTKLWRDNRPESRPVYPVDCRFIAEGLGIKVHGDDSLGDEFEAALILEADLKAILYNDNIREEGRKNFSIAHELGHFSLHRNQGDFHCSMDDLNEMQPHPKGIEQEANAFAATLLMPADDFRDTLALRTPTLEVVSELASRYDTTLTATAYRILELSKVSPVAVVRVRRNQVIGWSRSEGMRKTGFWLEKQQSIPDSALCMDRGGQVVDSELWLKPGYAGRWELTQSAVWMPYYDQTLVLLSARSAELKDEWCDPEEYSPDPFAS